MMSRPIYLSSEPFLRFPTKFSKDTFVRISLISCIEWDDEDSCYCVYLTDGSCCKTTASFDDLLRVFSFLK